MDIIKEWLKECDVNSLERNLLFEVFFFFVKGAYKAYTKHHPEKEAIYKRDSINHIVSWVYVRVKDKHSEQEVREQIIKIWDET